MGFSMSDEPFGAKNVPRGSISLDDIWQSRHDFNVEIGLERFFRLLDDDDTYFVILNPDAFS